MNNEETEIQEEKKLTKPQQKFLIEYLETGFITRAEKAAGISPGYGKTLLREPHIMNRLEQLQNRALEKHDVTMDEIIMKLAAIVDLDPLEAYETALAVQEVIVRHDSKFGLQDGISIENVTAKLSEIPPHIRKLMDIKFTPKGIHIAFLDKMKAYEMLTRIQGGYNNDLSTQNAPIINNINIIRHG